MGYPSCESFEKSIVVIHCLIKNHPIRETRDFLNFQPEIASNRFQRFLYLAESWFNNPSHSAVTQINFRGNAAIENSASMCWAFRGNLFAGQDISEHGVNNIVLRLLCWCCAKGFSKEPGYHFYRSADLLERGHLYRSDRKWISRPLLNKRSALPAD